jgi:hypothetical protein
MKRQKIKSGETEIVASGIVFSFYGNPVTVVFGDVESHFAIQFIFSTDGESRESSATVRHKRNNAVDIELINYNQSLTSGTQEPLQIGTYDGRPLFVHFRGTGFGRGDVELRFAAFVQVTEEGVHRGM